MSILLGPFDPLQLTFNLMNSLMQKGVITFDDVRRILKQSMDPSMTDEKKEEVLNSILKRT